MRREYVAAIIVGKRSLARRLRLLANARELRASLSNDLLLGVAHSPAFREAFMKGSRLPSSTLLVSPISTPVRRSLMRDWSRTYERIWLPQLTSLLESSRTFDAALRLLTSSS